MSNRTVALFTVLGLTVGLAGSPVAASDFQGCGILDWDIEGCIVLVQYTPPWEVLLLEELEGYQPPDNVFVSGDFAPEGPDCISFCYVTGCVWNNIIGPCAAEGACCYPDGSCAEDVSPEDCMAAEGTFKGTGTLCCDCDVDGDGVCTVGGDQVAILQCQGQSPIGVCAPADINCDGIIDDCDVDTFSCGASGGSDCCADNNGNGVSDVCENPIPTVSEWALVAMAAVVLIAGVFVLSRNRSGAGDVGCPGRSGGY